MRELFLLSHWAPPWPPWDCYVEFGGTDPESPSLAPGDHKSPSISGHQALPPPRHTPGCPLSGHWVFLLPSASDCPNLATSLAMLWKVPEKNNPKELVLGSFGSVISLPTEPVESWTAPCPAPDSPSVRRSGSLQVTGGKGRQKLGACRPFCCHFPPPAPSSGPAHPCISA